MRLFSFLFVTLFLFLSKPLINGQSAKSIREDADRLFQMYNFTEAAAEYQKIVGKTKDDFNVKRNLATSYLNSNLDRTLAIPILEELNKMQPNQPAILFDLGRAYMHGYQFEKAMLCFNDKAIVSSPDYIKLGKLLNQMTLQGQALVNDSISIAFQNLGNTINTAKCEMSPFAMPNEKQMVFSTNIKVIQSTGLHYYNVFMTVGENGQWKQAKAIDSRVNSIFDQIVGGTGPNNRVFVFHNPKGVMTLKQTAIYDNYMMDALQEMNLNIDPKKPVYGSCLSQSGDTLYFSSQQDEQSTDLYYCIKQKNKQWGPIVKMEGSINTPYDENYPMLSSDGTKFWFCSNRPASMGGYDVFVCYKIKNSQQWSQPVNMGFPINDAYDNFSVNFIPGKNRGYISAVRKEGLGDRDIYKMSFKKEITPTPVIKMKPTLPKNGVVRNNFISEIKITKDSVTTNFVYHSGCDHLYLRLKPGNYSASIELENKEAKQVDFVVPTTGEMRKMEDIIIDFSK